MLASLLVPLNYLFVSLTPQLFIEVPMPGQENAWSCICELGVSILPLSATLIFDFGLLPTIRYFFFYLIIL